MLVVLHVSPRLNYFIVVKSVSVGKSPPSGAFSQVQALASRCPQAQVAPVGFEFSTLARSHVHSPAGRIRQEHRGPLMTFSVAAFSQVQFN